MSADNSTAPAVVYKERPEFPGYRIGDDGSVWSRRKRGTGNALYDAWHQMRPRRDPKTGYMLIGLSVNSKSKTMLLHRLVLETFKGPCPEGKECAHLDGDQTNCRADNLAWKTPLENHADKKLHGTLARGVTQWKAKLTDEKVREIRANPEGLNGEQLAKKHGTTRATINKILRGETWRHVT